VASPNECHPCQIENVRRFQAKRGTLATPLLAIRGSTPASICLSRLLAMAPQCQHSPNHSCRANFSGCEDLSNRGTAARRTGRNAARRVFSRRFVLILRTATL
jgi:hypothetical protein